MLFRYVKVAKDKERLEEARRHDKQMQHGALDCILEEKIKKTLLERMVRSK